MAGVVTQADPVCLRIVVGYYGMPWVPYHGAWGGQAFETRESAQEWAEIACAYQIPVPKGLWPGILHKMVDVALVPYAPDRGQVIALCEPCLPHAFET